MQKIKEFMFSSLGGFGIVLFYVIGIFVSIFPLLMFDLPGWLYGILCLVVLFVVIYIPLGLEALWLVGFFGALAGPQDTIAIVYYVIFAIIFVSFIVRLIANLLSNRN